MKLSFHLCRINRKSKGNKAELKKSREGKKNENRKRIYQRGNVERKR